MIHDVLTLIDLQTAWGRANTKRRSQSNEYLWLFAALQGQPELAEGEERSDELDGAGAD